MRSLTVRLPEELKWEIEAESRERLQRRVNPPTHPSSRLRVIAGRIGSVDCLPPDLSAKRKRYLPETGYGKKRPR